MCFFSNLYVVTEIEPRLSNNITRSIAEHVGDGVGDEEDLGVWGDVRPCCFAEEMVEEEEEEEEEEELRASFHLMHGHEGNVHGQVLRGIGHGDGCLDGGKPNTTR